MNSTARSQFKGFFSRPSTLTTLSILVFIAGFIGLHQRTGQPVYFLALIPVTMIGWFYGAGWGLGSSLISLLLSLGIHLTLSKTGLSEAGFELFTVHSEILAIFLGGWIGGLFRKIQMQQRQLEMQLVDRTQAQSLLRASESRYRTMIEEAGDVVFLIDTQGNFEYVNALGERLTGYGLAELTQMHYLDLVRPDWREQIESFYRDQMETFTSETFLEFPIAHKDGRTRWVGQSAKLLMDGGEVTGLQGIVRDVTERKEAYEAAEEANRLKSRLLAMLSHDIRTPLNAVMGYADLMMSHTFGPLNKDQEKSLRRIMASTQQVTNLITNLLNLAEIEAGQLSAAYINFSPSELIEVIETLMTGLAEVNGLELKTEIADDVPDILLNDYQRIQQIIINLVNNAIKFTNVGSITVRIGRSGPSHWAIEVRDTGPGISVAEREKIFQPFQKAEDGPRGREGAGLGLSIVKEFTELLGGEVNLTSEVGRGSAFIVTLPLFPTPVRANNPKIISKSEFK